MNPFGNLATEALIVRLDSNSKPSERWDFPGQLSSIFPYLNWRGHVYIVDDDPVGQIDRASEVIRTVAEYLAGQKLAVIYVHPFIHMCGSGQTEMEEWEGLLSLMQPFEQEAYDQQSEVRMLILPIIEPQQNAPVEDMLSTVEFFRARLAKPSFYFRGESLLAPQVILEKDLRVYVDQTESSAESIIPQLWISHVFESILEKVDNDCYDLLDPCRRHLVIDEKSRAVFSCFSRWRGDDAFTSIECLDELPAMLVADRADTDCARCISRSCLSMEENLRANGRREEGRQVFLGLAVALSEKNQHGAAARHARKAFEFSDTDADRAAALLHEGLCHASLKRLEEADSILKEGASYTSDMALFSYNRGNVRFARQDYGGAISLFEESLAMDSPDVPRDDLLFNLAASYVAIEDFPKARIYLGLIDRMSAPVRFYEGVCDLGEGMTEEALAKFRESLALGPSPEDLARVRFYIATCLKDLGSYDAAIKELQMAVQADPKEYSNYNLLGFCFYQTCKYEEAIWALNKAIEIDPTSAVDYASIGSNLRELGRLEDAIAMYNMALSIDPELAFARENVMKLKEVPKKRSIE